jgi:hypothetical protein
VELCAGELFELTFGPKFGFAVDRFVGFAVGEASGAASLWTVSSVATGVELFGGVVFGSRRGPKMFRDKFIGSGGFAAGAAGTVAALIIAALKPVLFLRARSLGVVSGVESAAGLVPE